MNSPILKTKLYIPKQKADIVPRPNLLEQLNTGIDKKLTLLSTPAGYGKTTVLVQWLSCINHKVAWLSLDTSDSDKQRFIVYFIAALTNHVPNLKDILNILLSPSQMPDMVSIMTNVINNICDINEKIVIVLDDYHYIKNSEIDEEISFFIAHMPHNAHLVISTREDPKLPLVNLRAQNELREFSVNNLRFSNDEVKAFFEQLDMDISVNRSNEIEERAEGWIVGIKLLSMTIQNLNNLEYSINDLQGTQRHIIEYLVDEVVSMQSDPVQEFLLKTSILRQMSRALCDDMIDNKVLNNDKILNKLSQSNLFIVALDSQGEWYRYHHLFSDALKYHLKKKYAGKQEVIKLLHKRASKWYEAHNNFTESFYHATESRCMDRVIELLESASTGHINLEIPDLIIQWIDSLDRQTMNRNPVFYIWKSSLLLRAGTTEGVNYLLDRAEDFFNKVKHPTYVGRIAVARATLALTKYDTIGMNNNATLALNLLDKTQLPYLTSATWILAYVYQSCKNYEQAIHFYLKAKEYAISCQDTFTKGLVSVGLGTVYETLGYYEKAEKVLLETLSETSYQLLPYMSETHITLSKICVKQDKLTLAYEHAVKSIELVKMYGSQVDRFIYCKLQLANVLVAKGEIDEAITVLEKLLDITKSKGFDEQLPLIAKVLVAIYMKNDYKDLAIKVSKSYKLDANLAVITIDPLTDREVEILHLIAQGLTNKQIGENLFLALDTVKGHNRRIFEKLHVSRRTEAVAKAREYGII